VWPATPTARATGQRVPWSSGAAGRSVPEESATCTRGRMACTRCAAGAGSRRRRRCWRTSAQTPPRAVLPRARCFAREAPTRQARVWWLQQTAPGGGTWRRWLDARGADAPTSACATSTAMGQVDTSQSAGGVRQGRTKCTSRGPFVKAQQTREARIKKIARHVKPGATRRGGGAA